MTSHTSPILSPDNCTVVLADKAAFRAASRASTGSNGQGLTALLNNPVVKSARFAGGPARGMDHIHLTRIDGTNYLTWCGRRSNGYHYDFGAPMEMVAVNKDSAP